MSLFYFFFSKIRGDLISQLPHVMLRNVIEIITSGSSLPLQRLVFSTVGADGRSE